MVIKTSDYVLDVIGESRCDWNAKKKFYFWRTFYTPIGCVKNIVLLPILYVSFSIFIVLYLFSNDIIKYMSLAVCFPHIYAIVYDIYKKILNRKK